MDSVSLFPFADYWWVYLAFLGFVGVMLALDLGVFHRKAHAVGLREAAGWSVFWVSLALLVNWIFYRFALHQFRTDPRYLGIPGFEPAAEAGRVGMEFLTAFVVEKALAVDNIFVFVMIFGALGTPAIYQHRVLFLGILGAIVFRAAFIALGAQLLAYHWVMVFFGIFLALTGIKMLFVPQTITDPVHSWPVRKLRTWLPITEDFEGQKFLTRRNGALFGTPLLVALVFIEVMDIVFAIDSVPAIFALTREPLIVFISNILAILGLRSLYFLLAGVVDRFVYLKYGLAGVLIFVGLKMAWLNDLLGGKFPIGWSLGIIATLIVSSIAVSLIVTARRPSRGKSKRPVGSSPDARRAG